MARRRYQRGSVFLRGKRELVWVARWREDVIGPDGLIHRVRKNEVLGRKCDFRTKKLALRELESRVAPVNRVDYRALRSDTFAIFAETWKKKVLTQYKPSTRSVIESQLRTSLIPFFGAYLMKDITWHTMQGFVQNCNKSPKTCRNFLGTLKMMWKVAKAGGWASHDPFAGLVLPKRNLRQGTFYTAEEASRIISAATGKYKALYWIAAETGMRPGELCGLKVSDLDIQKLTVTVGRSVWRNIENPPKTANGYRRMAISPQLAAFLATYIATITHNPLNLVIPSVRGKALWPSQIMRQELKPLCTRLGIFPKGLRSFRHCSATMMDQAGTPTKVRQERLGHAPGSKVTEIHYTHALGSDDRIAAATMGDWLTAVVQ